MDKPRYDLKKSISPNLFRRRNMLRELLNDAEDDITRWLRFLNRHGKLPGINLHRIKQVEMDGNNVLIVHEADVNRWGLTDPDEPTTELQRVYINEDDFFHPVIDKEAPRQMDIMDAS